MQKFLEKWYKKNSGAQKRKDQKKLLNSLRTRKKFGNILRQGGFDSQNTPFGAPLVLVAEVRLNK